MSTILAYFGPGQPLYLLFFAAMIIFFTYFYTLNVSFKTDDVADNLKNQNGFIPGIRPARRPRNTSNTWSTACLSWARPTSPSSA
jgi:preprotein translocase subunit SecY